MPVLGAVSWRAGAVVEIGCRCRVLVLAVCVVETRHAVLRRFFLCKTGSCQCSPEKSVLAIWGYVGHASHRFKEPK